MKPNAIETGVKRSVGRPRKTKRVETSGPRSIAPPPVPEVVMQPVVLPPAPPEPAMAPIAVVDMVLIGEAECPALPMPIGDVLSLLGQEVLDRIAYLRGSRAISGYASRLRMSDGRNAPIYLTVDDDGLKFNHGCEVIAAAQDMAKSDIFVVTVPASLSDDLQNHIVNVVRGWEDEDLKATRR